MTSRITKYITFSILIFLNFQSDVYLQSFLMIFHAYLHNIFDDFRYYWLKVLLTFDFHCLFEVPVASHASIAGAKSHFVKL